MPLKIEDSLIGRVVREGEPIMIPNVLEEKQYRYPELARKTGLSSLLAVPMFTREGKVLGTFAIHYREVRNPDAVDLELIENAGHMSYIEEPDVYLAGVRDFLRRKIVIK